MIPLFPQFTPLSLSHKNTVRDITSKFELYSDFDFTSMFCWSAGGTTEVSILNDNLVVRMPDYLSGERIYTLIGDNEIDKSLNELLQKTKVIELVPEPVIKSIQNKDSFIIKEDINHFDYIYSLEDHANFNGKNFKSKRNKMSRFINNHGSNIILNEIDFKDPEELKVVKEIFLNWAAERAKTPEEITQESDVIDKFIKYSENFNLYGLKFSVAGKAAGFSIVEMPRQNFAIYHFQKVLDSSGVGADVYLTNQTSKFLLKKGCKYINWEQDLGINGLRLSKTNYQPIKFLKKFRVEGA